MLRPRKRHSPDFKARVAVEAIRGLKTTAQLAREFQVHPVPISPWKRQALDRLPEAFGREASSGQRSEAELTAPLFEELGRLKMARDWLKKSLPRAREAKAMLIEPRHPQLSVARPCALLDLPRSSGYFAPAGESAEHLARMRRIDAQYLKTPFCGSRQMTAWRRRPGHPVNRQRVPRLMGLMGLQGAVPGPHPSRPHPAHPVYPYLIGHLQLGHSNRVWATDITSVPMPLGFPYLVAISDGYRRSVLAWALSNTLDTGCCLEALDRARAEYQPGVFNTDQGAPFTSSAFTERLKAHQILISRDGRGRALDHACIERLWRTVKYEDIYLRDYQSVPELNHGLTDYFQFYNHERPHSALGGKTPAEVHWASLPTLN